MCGIAGIINDGIVNRETVKCMINSLRHRGPDGEGFYFEPNIAIGHARLSIIDLEYGNQPIKNENEEVVVVYNGEIYNYKELKGHLINKGHCIKNNSDGSILPHMYEEYGERMFEKLNGQFAIAIWDKKKTKLVLGRDRMGEKPLYYYHKNKLFCFASEIKAIFKTKYVTPIISKSALGSTFFFQTPLWNQCIFEDVYAVPPGNYITFVDGKIFNSTYWSFSYTNIAQEKIKSTDEYIAEAEEKLVSAICRNMHSDVPISTYLSGGLDSSLITAIAAKIGNRNIDTFSICFPNSDYDESEYQEIVSRHIGTNHHKIMFETDDIPKIITNAVVHTEVPIFSAGGLGMYKLAELVNAHSRKVVLCGQGADELFGGYSWFRETKIREFCNRYPHSQMRKLLWKKINIDALEQEKKLNKNFHLFFTNQGAKELYGSQLTKWFSRPLNRHLFSSEYQEQIKYIEEEENLNAIAPMEVIGGWSSMQREQFLSMTTTLPNYLLCSLGDRPSMAFGVECRHPFLDYEIIEYARSLPDTLKVLGLEEKYILKKIAYKYLPKEIIYRKKKPYKAPVDIKKLMQNEFVKEQLSYEALVKYGIFNPDEVTSFLMEQMGSQSTNKQNVGMFMGILTTQILYNEFIYTLF